MRAGECASRAKVRAFTLIEVLVVLVIVGVVVAALTLAAGGSGARELERAARRTQGLIGLACERAVLSGRDIGFVALSEGLRFGYYELEGWRAMRDTGSDELRARPWGEGVEVQAERDGEPVPMDSELPSEPPFACLSSGELTPFRLQFSRSDVRDRWTLRGRIDGLLELDQVSHAP
jgi:general secretion pathway protein H